MRLPSRLAPLALAVLLAACAELPKMLAPAGGEPPKAAAPQITEEMLRDRARDQLAAGVRQYEAGEIDNAQKSLTSSLDHGLLSKPDQSRARKLLAFIHCASGREAACRDEFRKAFEINPEFSLTTAEDGHPIWGPVYRNVRTQLIAEREAAQQRKSPTFIALPKAEQTLQDGLVKYDAGDYTQAHKLLEAAFNAGLREKADQVRALKHMAFSLCLQEKWRECRQAFIRIYDVDPDFDLTPAEAGHPSWTRTFAGAKSQAKRAIAAKEAQAKERAARPAAPAVAAPPAKKTP
jgi:tetratricopeptide (TPR) repeat protein